jgi:5-methylcytosine-specific restriction endonuclease McrA
MVAGSRDHSDYSQERCWWCGTPFPPMGRRVYCSTYCRRAAWWVLNPGALAASSARFRERHPDRAREIARLAYQRHRQERLALSARWALANRQRKAAAEQRRRAAKRQIEGHGVDPADWLAMVVAAQGRCTYCGEVRPLTMDHRMPLSRGGRHELENVVPACKPCNSRKHTRTEEESRALLRDEREPGISESEGPYEAPNWGASGDISIAAHDSLDDLVA